MLNAVVDAGWSAHYISGAQFPVSDKAVFYKTPELLNNPLLIATYYLFVLPIRICFLHRKEKFDRFVAFGFPYGFVLKLPAMLFRVPLIIMVRGNWIKELEAAGRPKLVIEIAKLLQSAAARSSASIITNGESLKTDISQQLPAYCGAKIKVLPNDIPKISQEDLQSFKANRKNILAEAGIADTNAFILGYSGTLKPIKEVDLLIKALNKINNDHLYLLIVGSGPLETELKQLTQQLNLSSRINFLGWQEDPLPYIACFDLMVLPTKSEGCPNAILEALACAVPCIASAVTGVADILTDPVTMFDPSNTDSLVSMLQRITSSRDKLEQIKNACSARTEVFQFSWNKCLLDLVKEPDAIAQTSYN